MYTLILIVALAGGTDTAVSSLRRIALEAQAPSTPSTQAAPSQEKKPEPAEPYAYRPNGRRDPFMTLIGTGDTRLPTKHGDGPANLTVSEISVRGILKGQSGLIAMIQGTDKRTYVIHPGEKLLDGTIKSISPQFLTIVQDVTDPLSVVKQREIRKPLKPLQDAPQ